MTDQSPTPVRQDLMPCIPPSGWEFFTVVDTENGVAVYRDELPGRAVVRRRVTYGDWEPVHPGNWAPEPHPEGSRGIAAAPTPPQDGPHAPQDGPQHPDAGAETPDGTRGRQTGAGGGEVLREPYAAALSTLTVLGGAPPARLVPVIDWGAGKTTRIADWQPLGTLLDALLAVRDRELERLEKLHQAHLRVEQRLAGQSLAAESAVEQIRLHIAAHRHRLQYADPILLRRLEAVLRQVGELEAAGGGEQRS